MKVRPLFDKVLVELEKETVSEGGIILPIHAEPNEHHQKGIVVAVGEGRRDGKGNRIPNGVKPGDRVLFDKWTVAELIVNGEKMFIAIVDGIIGVFDEEKGHTQI